MEEEQVDDVVPPEQIKCHWHKGGGSEIRIVGGVLPKGVEQTQLTSLKRQLAVLGETKRASCCGDCRTDLAEDGVQQTMHPKVFACLLLSILISTNLSRSMSASHPGDGRISKEVKAVPGADPVQRRSSGGLIRREWPESLSQDQKHLVSQFLPHIYAAELASKGSYMQNEDTHYPSWMDFGRRSSEDLDGDA